MSASRRTQPFPIPPPIEPMLAKLAEAVPDGEFRYEPKWDGFRALAFPCASGVFTQTRQVRFSGARGAPPGAVSE